MVVVNENEPGIVSPTGFFDPLGLSSDIPQRTFKRWQESEIKHGRLAMMAWVASVFAEKYHPYYDGLIDGPAINHFAKVEAITPGFWTVRLFLTAICEVISIGKGWAPPRESEFTIGWLKEDYVIGDLGLDSLRLREKSDDTIFTDLRNKELQNGRLAMIGIYLVLLQRK
jgi:hypothetical protein